VDAALVSVPLGVALAVLVAVDASPTPDDPIFPRLIERREAAVTSEELFDESSIVVTPMGLTTESLRVPFSGTVTSLDKCKSGLPINAGDVVLSVDGQPRIALATKAPMYRVLRAGDSGADVSQLQRALADLGEPVGETGRMDTPTISAVRALRFRAGDSGATGSIGPSSFVWLPENPFTPTSCDLTLGALVAENSSIATRTSLAQGLRASLPDTRMSIDRSQYVVEIAGVLLSLDEEGFVSDIPDVIEQMAIVSAQSNAGPINATARLKQPLQVFGVPTSALTPLDETRACVQLDEGQWVRVDVISGQFGKAYVSSPNLRAGEFVVYPVRWQQADSSPC
jgi:peptidoglycan hydrolase-like protein with peptidoglycan-binding domain